MAGTARAKGATANMNLAESLQQHVFLCEEMHALFQEENRILQNTQKPPSAEFLARKSALLPRLDSTRQAVIEGKGREPHAIAEHVSTIERLQKKLLSLMLLDRENEKLLLKFSFQAHGPRTAVRPMPQMVGRAYSKAAA